MRIFVYILLLLLFLPACKKKEFVIDNLNGSEIQILGHGGSGIADLYPLDTKESVFNCLNLGADGSEIDIQLTKDNVLVLYHNEDLSSNTNMSGSIREHTFEELKEAVINSTPYAPFGITSLEELLSEVPAEKGFTFSLDIKLFSAPGETTESFFNDFVAAIDSIFDSFSMHNTAYVESQSSEFMALLQAADPDIRIFVYPQDFSYGFQVAQDLGLYGISISTDVISQEQVKQAHDSGFRVIIWNVKSKSEHDDAIMKNPDIIESDNLDYLIDLLK